MINSIEIMNFKSIPSAKLNFEKGINLIYGQNGVGKTTVIEIGTFFDNVWNKKNAIIDKLKIIKNFKENLSNEFFTDTGLVDIRIYDQYCSIGMNQPIKIKTSISIEEYEVDYCIELSNGDIIDLEVLSYKLKGAKGKKKIIFNRKKDQLKLNDNLNKLFKVYNHYFEEEKDISILAQINYLLKERQMVADDEIINLISKLGKHINYFIDSDNMRLNQRKSSNYLQGVIRLSNNEHIEERVNTYKEKVKNFSMFVKKFDNNIESVNVLEEKKDNITFLSIEFKKNLSGNVYNIKYKYESAGTKKYLTIFNIYMILKSMETTILIDEFANHFHRGLSNEILKLFDEIISEKNSQLIITTHETSFLNMNFINNKSKKVIEREDGKLLLTNYGGVNSRVNLEKKYLDKI